MIEPQKDGQDLGLKYQSMDNFQETAESLNAIQWATDAINYKMNYHVRITDQFEI